VNSAESLAVKRSLGLRGGGFCRWRDAGTDLLETTFEAVHIQDLSSPAPGRARERFDARGKTLEVYRPRFGEHR
jgi:hypothetical protein